VDFSNINLFTQNSDLRESGVFGWTLPAHKVTLTNGKKFNTCPNAGVCGAFCYAKSGTYMFSNVRKAHIQKLELVLYHRQTWIDLMIEELNKGKYIGRYVRIHDAGDFFSWNYTMDWFKIIKCCPWVQFYTYTKEVKLFKHTLKEQIPKNLIVIYSYGGKQDHLIEPEIDRHSDVFHNYDEMISKGYIDISENDLLSALSPNHKIGLYRNNIKHFIKKMGSKNFSDFAKKSK